MIQRKVNLCSPTKQSYDCQLKQFISVPSASLDVKLMIHFRDFCEKRNSHTEEHLAVCSEE